MVNLSKLFWNSTPFSRFTFATECSLWQREGPHIFQLSDGHCPMDCSLRLSPVALSRFPLTFSTQEPGHEAHNSHSGPTKGFPLNLKSYPPGQARHTLCFCPASGLSRPSPLHSPCPPDTLATFCSLGKKANSCLGATRMTPLLQELAPIPPSHGVSLTTIPRHSIASAWFSLSTCFNTL